MGYNRVLNSINSRRITVYLITMVIKLANPGIICQDSPIVVKLTVWQLFKGTIDYD